jgi:hypothetical protein|tara:strand:- start:1152 stop:2249 length:1098 start_codon:yes stop_codon:yes gene_type:complete
MDPISKALYFGAAGGAGGAPLFGTTNGSTHSSGGRVVLNGYGLLFYIGSGGVYNTWGHYASVSHAAKNFTLSGYAGFDLDIEMVGGGGANTGGGGGGGGGAAGVRLVYAPTSNLTLRIGGGMNTHWESNTYGSSKGHQLSNTSVIDAGSTIATAEGAGGSNTQIAQFSCPNSLMVVGSEGRHKNGGGAGQYQGAQFNAITNIDTGYEYPRGGNGQYLQGFGSASSGDGKGLGGGGGGQNRQAYGGSSSTGSGGRYGYDGGQSNSSTDGSGYSSTQAQAGSQYGYGPSPGESNKHRLSVNQGSYNNGGGGGSFGGGGGDDGSGGSRFGHGGTGAGGAILVRIDTTQYGIAVSGRPGWPTSNGPWTG